ncbi:hypothetical protein D3C75_845000 [compost metagenome]
MRLAEYRHKRQRGKFPGIIGKHRNENGDTRPDDKHANQRHNRHQRTNHKAVATQPFEAGQGECDHHAERDKQHDSGVAHTALGYGCADDHKRHAKQCPTGVKVVALALFWPQFIERAQQQQRRQNVPQQANIDARPAISRDQFFAGRFKQAVIQAPAWQQGESQPAKRHPPENSVPLSRRTQK